MTAITETLSPATSRAGNTAHGLLRHLAFIALTLGVLLIHGYHPLAEDGGLYVAGIESALDPSLFPHDLAFAAATRHYSLFAPLMAQVVRTFHIPLAWLLLFTYLTSAWLMIYAAWRIAAQCFRSQPAQFCSAALLAAWFTLPMAGTSLLLMDPYTTARTLSTPLSLLAISFALSFQWDSARRLLPCILCLAVAAGFHPLMAAYAAALVIALLVAKFPSPRAQLIGWTILTTATVLIAGILQTAAPAESAPTIAAAFSRYYWFLSQWQWFEWCGLAGPLLVFALLLRYVRRSPIAALCHAGIALGLIATLISLLFAHEQYSTHLVARLQPLRAFLLLYAVMIVLLGGALAEVCSSAAQAHRQGWLLSLLILIAMGYSADLIRPQTFSASLHLELPWRDPANPWSQAFVWARGNTPANALFALDADYITTPGEDAQTFRATAQRSTLPDFSKDGGEAAINPSLAAAWFTGMTAQKGLSHLSAKQRRERLQPLGVTWLIVHADAPTGTACPYENAIVKVCPLD